MYIIYNGILFDLCISFLSQIPMKPLSHPMFELSNTMAACGNVMSDAEQYRNYTTVKMQQYIENCM